MNSELILNPDGSIYHLALHPEDLARHILLVGDPGRVDRIAAHFDTVRLRKEKREFRTVTGSYRGMELTVLSTGIGPDNIDIVMNELDALATLDLQRRTPLEQPQRLRLLRLGTCGGLQPDLAPGTMALSAAAVGLDPLPAFYRLPLEGGAPFQAAARAALGKAPAIAALAYGVLADAELLQVAAMQHPHLAQGITFTAPGFYGPQGRSLGRLSVTMPGLPDHMASVTANGLRTINMEMEAAPILALGQALGHACGVLAVVLANRPGNEFHPDPRQAVDDLIEQGLALVSDWAQV